MEARLHSGDLSEKTGINFTCDVYAYPLYRLIEALGYTVQWENDSLGRFTAHGREYTLSNRFTPYDTTRPVSAGGTRSFSVGAGKTLRVNDEMASFWLRFELGVSVRGNIDQQEIHVQLLDRPAQGEATVQPSVFTVRRELPGDTAEVRLPTPAFYDPTYQRITVLYLPEERAYQVVEGRVENGTAVITADRPGIYVVQIDARAIGTTVTCETGTTGAIPQRCKDDT